MQNAMGKALIALTILIVLLLIALNFFNRKIAASAPPAMPVAAARTPNAFPPAHHPPRTVAASPRPVPASADLAVSRDKIEPCLVERQRNAASLLAAFHALNDTNYLIEAATNFPSDPHVIVTVLARNAFPGDRRKWLAAFKTAAPQNSLADYLSAEDDLENGRSDAAIHELEVAGTKPLFDDFTMQSRLEEEELVECGGKATVPAATIALAGAASDDLAMLGTLKQIVARLTDLREQKAQAGDTNFGASLSPMEVALANRFFTGDSGKLIIDQLVGMAIENIAVSQLDPNTSYDFLDGQSPAQVLAENKEQRATLRQLQADFHSAYPLLTADEMVGYLQRSKIYGEFAAMQWVVQQHPPQPGR